jgi:hypothetical protein
MTGFIDQLVSRHTAPVPVIAPRLPGLFESETAAPVIPGASFSDMNEAVSGKSVYNQPVAAAPPSAVLPVTGTDNAAGVFSSVNSGEENTAPQYTFIPEREVKDTLPPAADIFYNTTHQHITQQLFYPEQTGINASQNNNTVQQSFFPEEGYLSVKLPAAEKAEGQSSAVVHTSSTTEIIKEVHTGMTGENKAISPVLPSVQSAAIAANTIAAPFLRQENSTVIKVSIGRIEVKAMTVPAPAKKSRAAATVPKMTLEEYLNKRNNKNK